MLDATTPPNTRFGAQILLPIQPAVVYGTFQRVYARLFESINLFIDSQKRIVPIRWIVANAATLETAVV
jgi:hypothetical protein